MSDDHLTPARRPGVGDPPPPLAVAAAPAADRESAPPATTRPAGPRWLPNILLLLALSLLCILASGFLITQGNFTAARTVFGMTALAALAVALRPLFVRGRRRLLRSFAFVAIFLGLLLSSAALGYFLFFRIYSVPTGSMALTIQGYHRDVQCPECGYWSAVNLSSQMDPGREHREVVTGCTCANCRRHITLPPDDAVSGDRILTARFVSPPGDLPRAALVTFWLPLRAQEPAPPMYVARVMGLPGETLAISYGRLYRTTALSYDDAAIGPEERWQPDHWHENDPRALELFKQGKFEIIRKDPQTLLALRRLIYDNDHRAADLAGVLPPRWAGGAWAADGTGFRNDGRGDEVDWLRYRHTLRPLDWPERSDLDYAKRVREIKRRAHKPELICDFFAYNSFEVNAPPRERWQGDNWVGDLMLECRLAVTKAEGEFWLELSKGVDRFQARFDLKSGDCTLFRLGAGGKLRQLQAAPTRVKQPGQYLLRLANVDERLTVWVDGDLPFGEGAAYDPPPGRGPTANDLEPASLGRKGAAVSVQGLKLYRDTYYGTKAGQPDFGPFGVAPEGFWSDPAKWGPLRELPVRTLYVRPGHYFCLGDNSAASSDSRDWGLVPEGLLAGRVLLIYAPANRAGLLR
jgi:signal peptidase I